MTDMVRHGWTGRILEVYLGSRTSRVIEPPAWLYDKFIGGKGLAGHYLSQHLDMEWDDPDMPILIFAGPLVGTRAPTSGRATVMSRSPLTGTVGDSSVGGGLGTKIKQARYDGIILRGSSDKWIGVEIVDDEVAFVDATPLLGLTNGDAMELLAGKGSVALVGPAAQRGVRFSSLMVDRHFAAARNGIGLSFAKKRIKYLSCDGGTRVPVHDAGELDRAREDIFRLVSASPILLGESGIRNMGTPALYDLMHTRRMMPTDNFRTTFFPDAPNLNAYAVKKRYSPRRKGCAGCHILCKKGSADGVVLPEFETLSHFTALIGNNDLHTAVRANVLCNEYGIDTISAAVTLSCFAEIEGEDLTPDRIMEILGQIVRREGIGDQLADGSALWAASRGKPSSSMSVKGLELPAYDPRGAYGMALAYATSTRGGCHLRAYPIGHEILRKPVATDRFSFAGKARIIKIAEDTNAVIDSLTACKFVFFASSLEEYAHALSAVTGVETTATDLSKTGERIYYHERIMNARWGFNSKDDDLPPRFFEEAGSSGPDFDVPPLNRDDFLRARARYYKVRGLDADGAPTRDKAKELDLEWNDL